MRTAAALVALPTSAAIIWVLLRTGLAGRFAAAPRGDRWRMAATPKVGGIGIFAGIAAGLAAAMAVGAVRPGGQLLGILAGCAILFVAGLADDLVTLKPGAKIAAQLAAAGAAIAGGLTSEIVDNPVLGGAIALVWLVGMTNAFNLLDNMDGLAATLAGIATFYFALDAYLFDENVAALVLALGVGLACAGFLPFNVRPGRPAAIIMGDSGSQVLGFALGSLGLLASYKAAGTAVATLLVPILVLAVPIVDTALVTVVRLLEGRPVHQGGRDHSSHRLVYRGLSEGRALVLLAVVAASLGATSLAYNVIGSGRLTAIGVLLTFAALVQFASFLGDLDRTRTLPPERGPWLWRTFVVHRRRLVEVLVDGALVAASFLAAYFLVLGGSGSENQRTVFMLALPAVLFARYAAFIPFALYRGLWRYAGARDAVAIVLAVAVSGAAAYGFVELTVALGDFPRSIFVVDVFLCTLLVGASRFAERLLDAGIESLRSPSAQERVVIVGAGRAGRSLLRELRETPGKRVVAFIDDDERFRSRRLQGVTVAGPLAEISRILDAAHPDLVLVTIPDAPRERLRSVVADCAEREVPCRFVRRELDIDPASLITAAP
jgi:UDP-GlcNAc:undecaprenyl-phosphate/decaprenyl-phosphate GlcNAc-1-phosphate transferase